MGIVDRESVPGISCGGARTSRAAWEIFKSNVRVARIILSPRIRVDPSIVHFRASQRTDLGRFIYANSITLTPGTSRPGSSATTSRCTPSRVRRSTARENEMNRRVAVLEGEGA